jgi:hypothetical protein
MFGFLKKLFHKKDKKQFSFSPTINIPNNNRQIKPNRYVPIKAVNQDISKFMKHGRQTAQYRQAVRAHINPEDEE